MAAGADRLGDAGDGAPERWDEPLRRARSTCSCRSPAAVTMRSRPNASACRRRWMQTASSPATCSTRSSPATTASTSASPTASANRRSRASRATAWPARASRSAAVRGTASGPHRPVARRPEARVARRPPGEFVLGYATRTAVRRPRRRRRCTATARSWSGASCARTSPASARSSPMLRPETGLEPGLVAAKVDRPLAHGSPLVLRPVYGDARLGNDRERVNDFAYARRPRRPSPARAARTSAARTRATALRAGAASPPATACCAAACRTARRSPRAPRTTTRTAGRVRLLPGEHRAPVRDRPGALAERRRRLGLGLHARPDRGGGRRRAAAARLRGFAAARCDDDARVRDAVWRRVPVRAGLAGPARARDL